MGLSELMEGVSKKDDEKMALMTSIKEKCDEAGVEAPDDVTEYINDPEHGVIGKLRPGIERGVIMHQDDGQEVVEIHLDEIDPKIDIIRITKSW